MFALLSNTNNGGVLDHAIPCGGNFLELNIAKGQTLLLRNRLSINHWYGHIWSETKMRLRGILPGGSILELVHSGGMIGWALGP